MYYGLQKEREKKERDRWIERERERVKENVNFDGFIDELSIPASSYFIMSTTFTC